MKKEKSSDGFIKFIEKHFGGSKRRVINKKYIREFNSDFANSNFSKTDFLKQYYLFVNKYFIKFSRGFLLKPEIPLYNDSEYILKINSHIFSDIFDEVISESPPDIAEHYRSLKVNVVGCLCGLSDDPLALRLPPLPPRFEKYANNNEPVLILGETGTGKELHAKAIHYLSPRKTENYVTLNCSAIPDKLLDSGLFGYVKGAFTGANEDTEGYLNAVGEGTLFLDEIGDVPLVSCQVNKVG